MCRRTRTEFGVRPGDRDRRPVVAQEHRDSVRVPFGKGQFGTAHANQSTIELILMEADGDSLDPAQCKEIGRGTVQLSRGVPKGSEVEITFEYGADGTMGLHAREVSTNSECDVRIVRSGVMTDQEVQTAGNQLAVLTAGEALARNASFSREEST